MVEIVDNLWCNLTEPCEPSPGADAHLARELSLLADARAKGGEMPRYVLVDTRAAPRPPLWFALPDGTVKPALPSVEEIAAALYDAPDAFDNTREGFMKRAARVHRLIGGEG